MATGRTIKPTLRTRGYNTTEIELFGQETGDWKIQTVEPENFLSHNREVLERIITIGEEVNISNIFSPRLLFNALVGDEHHPDWFPINIPGRNCRITRGARVDAVQIKGGEGVFIPSAGCPTVIIESVEGEFDPIVAHAGRDCLIDRSELSIGRRTPQHVRPARSVIDAIMAWIPPFDPTSIHVSIVCGTGAQNFDHLYDDKLHGSYNKKMIEHIVSRFGQACVHGPSQFGRINLRKLITVQLEGWGIPRGSICVDNVDTFSCSGGASGSYTWHDHRRDSAGSPGAVTGRNGVFVYCS